MFEGGVGLAGGMNWRAQMLSTIINNDNDVLGYGFVGAGEFNLLSDRDICVTDGHLLHEVMEDDDGAVFKNCQSW